MTVCLVCRKPLPDLAVKHADEFCSTGCARKFYGTELQVHKQGSHMASGTGT